MNIEKKIDNIRYRKFAPIDRDSPIFEILFNEEIILDVSKDDETGEFFVMFHKNITNSYISADLLIDIVEKGKKMIVEDESN